MPAYLIARAIVTDSDGYATYSVDVPTIVDRFTGRFLARGGRTIGLEGPDFDGRIVIIEFPDLVAVERFYNSTEYQSLKRRREPFGMVEFIAVEGI